MNLGRTSWRDLRCVSTLAEAIGIARHSGRACRVTLHKGVDVSLPAAINVDGAEGPAKVLAEHLRRLSYWAAPLDLVVIPNAIFLTDQSLVIFPDMRICEELVYGIYGDNDPNIWKANGQSREITDWHEAKIKSATFLRGVNALIHPRWHQIYFHWFMEAMPALFDPAMQRDLIDCFCFPQGPSFQQDSLQAAGVAPHCRKILDQPAYRLELAVMPTHLFARTWVHPAVKSALGLLLKGIRNRIPAAAADDGQFLYLSREDAQARKMVNEPELSEGLASLGYRQVVASHLSFAEQVKIFSSAKGIVSPHGSGLTNMLFQPEGGRVMELRPLYAGSRGMLWDRSYQVMSALLGRQYSALISENAVGTEDWRVDIAATLEKAKKFIG